MICSISWGDGVNFLSSSSKFRCFRSEEMRTTGVSFSCDVCGRIQYTVCPSFSFDSSRLRRSPRTKCNHWIWGWILNKGGVHPFYMHSCQSLSLCDCYLAHPHTTLGMTGGHTSLTKPNSWDGARESFRILSLHAKKQGATVNPQSHENQCCSATEQEVVYPVEPDQVEAMSLLVRWRSFIIF